MLDQSLELHQYQHQHEPLTGLKWEERRGEESSSWLEWSSWLESEWVLLRGGERRRREERREERGEWHQQQSLHSTPGCHVSRRLTGLSVMMDLTELCHNTISPAVRTCNNIYTTNTSLEGKVASYLLLVAPETIRLLQDVGEPLVARNNQGRICPMREANPRKPNLPVIWYMQQTFCPGKIRKRANNAEISWLAGADQAPASQPG